MSAGWKGKEYLEMPAVANRNYMYTCIYKVRSISDHTQCITLDLIKKSRAPRVVFLPLLPSPGHPPPQANSPVGGRWESSLYLFLVGRETGRDH